MEAGCRHQPQGPDISSYSLAPFLRSCLFSAVFEQLEYCYSILSGSARNCGNQLRCSRLQVWPGAAQTCIPGWRIIRCYLTEEGRNWVGLYGNCEFLARIHPKLRRQWCEKPLKNSQSVTGRLFAGGQGWFLVSSAASQLEALETLISLCRPTFVCQSKMWGKYPMGKIIKAELKHHNHCFVQNIH